jgi:hypothetical protein
MIKIRMKVSEKKLPLDETTKKECEKGHGSFCYMHPDKEPNSSKPKKNQSTEPTKPLKTISKPEKPKKNKKETVMESDLELDQKIISDKNRIELKRKMLEVSSELRGYMMDYVDQLKQDGVLEDFLKDRHFIRKFMDSVIDSMEDSAR